MCQNKKKHVQVRSKDSKHLFSVLFDFLHKRLTLQTKTTVLCVESMTPALE